MLKVVFGTELQNAKDDKVFSISESVSLTIKVLKFWRMAYNSLLYSLINLLSVKTLHCSCRP